LVLGIGIEGSQMVTLRGWKPLRDR
jgi:hypothetical protein